MAMIVKTMAIAMFMLPLHAQCDWFNKKTYWHCLLTNLENVQSNTIAQELIDQCKDRHPFYTRIWISKESPMFGVKTAQECTAHHGKDINSELAARYIQSACYKLYIND